MGFVIYSGNTPSAPSPVPLFLVERGEGEEWALRRRRDPTRFSPTGPGRRLTAAVSRTGLSYGKDHSITAGMSTGMDARTHWEKIYTQKAPDQVSWYRPHLETSLALIEQTAAGRSASIIDVGAGESTLVDDLLVRGYTNVTVLDVSETAIDVNRKRLGKAAEAVHWLVADMTRVELEPSGFSTCGMTARCFTFSPRPLTVPPMCAKLPAPWGEGAM